MKEQMDLLKAEMEKCLAPISAQLRQLEDRQREMERRQKVLVNLQHSMMDQAISLNSLAEERDSNLAETQTESQEQVVGLKAALEKLDASSRENAIRFITSLEELIKKSEQRDTTERLLQTDLQELKTSVLRLSEKQTEQRDTTERLLQTDLQELKTSVLRLSEKQTEQRDTTERLFQTDLQELKTSVLHLSEKQSESQALLLAVSDKLKYAGNVYSGRYVFSQTKRFGGDFVWVTERFSNDIISEYIRQGFCGSTIWDGPDESLWDILPKNGTILDLGANVGAFIFPLIAKGWKGFAVEASSRNLDVLCKSIELNHLDVHVCDKAVYSKSGTVYFTQKGPQSYVQDAVHPNEPYEKVEAIALDDYEKDPVLQKIERLDLIKMDIEGSEPAALRGMHNFLKRFSYPPIYSEVNVWNLFCMGESQRKYFHAMAELGYTPYKQVSQKLYRLTEDYLPEIPCTDFFFLQEGSSLQDYIAGDYTQNREAVREHDRQMLHNMLSYLQNGGREENPLLPHIALFSYSEDYEDYRSDVDIMGLKTQIADILGETNVPSFTKMLCDFEKKKHIKQ